MSEEKQAIATMRSTMFGLGRRWLGGLDARILLLVAIMPAILLRFFNLTGRGITGSDTVYYTSLATAWSHGDLVYQIGPGLQVYRPFVLLLFSLGMRILGVNDYSLKVVNATADTATILLLFWVAYRLSNRCKWQSLSAAVIYAYLPLAIHMSRIELTHAISGTTVVLSLLFFVFHLEEGSPFRRRVFLLLTGVCVGLASLTHQELLMLLPGYLCFLVLSGHSQRHSPRAILASSALVAISALAVAAKMSIVFFSALKQSPEEPRLYLSSMSQGWADGIIYLPERAARFLWNALSVDGSWVLLYFFVISLAALAWLGGRRWLATPSHSPLTLPMTLPLILVLVHVFSCAAILETFAARVFLPLMPLVILWLVLFYSTWVQSRSPPLVALSAMTLAAILVVFNLGGFADSGELLGGRVSQHWHAVPPRLAPPVLHGARRLAGPMFRTTFYREIYDRIGDRVDEDARILITSSLMYPYPGRRPFQLESYFGDNAVYAIDHGERLETLLARYRIRYVLLSPGGADRRLLESPIFARYLYRGRWEKDAQLQLGAPYGFSRGDYSLRAEISYLARFLEARGARAVVLQPEFADRWLSGTANKETGSDWSYAIYELPRPAAGSGPQGVVAP